MRTTTGQASLGAATMLTGLSQYGPSRPKTFSNFLFSGSEVLVQSETETSGG